MTPKELEHAEKRMQQKWRDLVMAEQKEAPVQVLERMYNAYILTVEEYNRRLEQYQREHQDQPIPVPVKPDAESAGRGRRKKVS
ncbi:MAG TPA: hypothetical protein VFU49_09050 [Ktedonobacteraceae bacterium]|nr:hypothetical protein [Ktedonobacteraceae bacterium]